MLREALAIQRHLGVRNDRLAVVLGELGWVLFRRLRYDEADAAFREAVEVAAAAAGGARQTLAFQTKNWSLMLEELGRDQEAADNQARSLEVRREIYAAPHEAIHKSEASLARVLLDLGESARAAPLVRSALEGYRATTGEDAPAARLARIQEVRLMFRTPGIDVAHARQAAEDLIARMEAAEDPALNVARARRALGEGLLLAGQPAPAAATLRESERLLAERSPEKHTDRALSLALLGDALRSQGEVDQAIEAYRLSLERFAATVGDRHPRALEVRRQLEALRDAAR